MGTTFVVVVVVVDFSTRDSQERDRHLRNSRVKTLWRNFVSLILSIRA